MGKRLVIFTIFIFVIAYIASLTNYKPHYDSKSQMISSHKEILKEKENLKKALNNSAPVKAVANMELAKQIYTERYECAKCHGDKGQGVPTEEGPRLQGQHDWYIISQVKKIRSGKRKNEKMQEYMSSITDEEIKLVSAYIKSLKL